MQQRKISMFFGAVLVLASLPSALIAQTPTPRPILVGYFGQWGLYNSPRYTLKDLAANKKAAMLDQLNYAQAFVTGGHCSIADRNADLDHVFPANESVDGRADDPDAPLRGHFHQLAELKHIYPRLKVLISLEGRGADFAFDAQPENRQAFVASCVDLFIKGNLAANISAPGLFDGIDVDWEYPQGPDAINFLSLLTEFRRQMALERSGMMLSVAVGPSPRMYEGSDFHAISAQVDEVGLMTYDFAGPWMQTTGFVAPLYSISPPLIETSQSKDFASPSPNADRAAPAHTAPSTTSPQQPLPSGGAAGSVEAFLTAGVPAAKLLIGVPFYGYGWTQVPEVANGVFQEGTPIRGDQPYSYIQSLASASRIYRDPVSRTPWLFDGDAFWTYDDATSVGAKASYAVEHDLGGLMIWELSGDTPEGTLLSAAHQSLSTGRLAARRADNQRPDALTPKQADRRRWLD